LSISQSNYPIGAALVEAEKVLGENRIWAPENDKQTIFLDQVFEVIRGEALGARGITASHSVRSDNSSRLLTVRGILDLLVKWLEVGQKRPIHRDGQEWEGVALREKAGVSFLGSGSHRHPIVHIKTQSDDVVYMTIVDQQPDEFELTSVFTSLTEKMWPINDFSGVRFPMVDLRHPNEVDWIVGMSTVTERGLPTVIEKADQETRFKMNEVGAHVRSEFRVTMRIMASASIVKPYYVIDQPFLLAFTRRGLKQPLAVLFITEKEWKNPGTLDFN